MTLRNLSQDSLDLSAAFGFVRVEAMPACRHTGFSATHGGIVVVVLGSQSSAICKLNSTGISSGTSSTQPHTRKTRLDSLGTVCNLLPHYHVVRIHVIWRTVPIHCPTNPTELCRTGNHRLYSWRTSAGDCVSIHKTLCRPDKHHNIYCADAKSNKPFTY